MFKLNAALLLTAHLFVFHLAGPVAGWLNDDEPAESAPFTLLSTTGENEEEEEPDPGEGLVIAPPVGG